MRRAHAYALGAAAGALIAATAMYLPWHEWHQSHWDLYMGPDYHPSNPVSTDSAASVDTGADHAGSAPTILLVIAALIALAAPFLRRRWARIVSGIAAAATTVAAGLITVEATILAHMFDQVTARSGQLLCAFGGAAAFVFSILVAVDDRRAIR